MEPAPPELIAELQAEYDDVFARVMTANADVAERVLTTEMMVYYDPEDDVVVLTLGAPAPCVMLEVTDDIWLRLEPETDRLIGFEFLAASAPRASTSYFSVLLELLVEAGQHAPGTFVPLSPQARAPLAEGMRELIPA